MDNIAETVFVYRYRLGAGGTLATSAPGETYQITRASAITAAATATTATVEAATITPWSYPGSSRQKRLRFGTRLGTAQGSFRYRHNLIDL